VRETKGEGERVREREGYKEREGGTGGERESKKDKER